MLCMALNRWSRRPEPCQLLKGEEIAPVIEPVGTFTRVPPVQLGSDPPPLQNEAKVGFPDLLSFPCVRAPGTNFRSAATCGRAPTLDCRSASPGVVGTPEIVVPEPSLRIVQRWSEPKKKVLFLMIGPPTVPPNWCSL